MNKNKGLALILCLMLMVTAAIAKPKVKLGIDVLEERGFDILKGKRVALITNPTGVSQDLRSTVDILFEAPEVDLVALFGPEHGVRGNFFAGDIVDDNIDPITGVTVYSLYGKRKRPTPNHWKMLMCWSLTFRISDAVPIPISAQWVAVWKLPPRTMWNLLFLIDQIL